MNWNSARPTGPQRGTEVRRGLTKEHLRRRTQPNTCVSLWKFTLNSTPEPSKFPSTLEPIKQETESQAVETRNTGSTPSYSSDVELLLKSGHYRPQPKLRTDPTQPYPSKDHAGQG